MSDDSNAPWQTLTATPQLLLHPHFLSCDEATNTLAILAQDISWTSPTLRLYGKHHTIPRSQCWMGDPDIQYRYSARTLSPHPWHATVETLRDRIINALLAAGLPVARFNSVLLNRYEGGDQRMGWHSDDEPELGNKPIIASLSLGSERPLRFRTKTANRSRHAFNVWLPHGSLLLMGPGVQETWQHALTPRAIPGLRINLTFRYVHPYS